jgi:hypothetical protein
MRPALATDEPRPPRRRLALATLLLGVGATAIAVAGCSSSHGGAATATVVTRAPAPASTAAAKPPAPVVVVPHLVVRVAANPGARWSVVARVHGSPAVWFAQRSGVTLMRFDQALVRVDLHAGSSDGGEGGWRYGDQISPREIHLVIAAVNGGFKLTHGEVGFLSGGHVAVPLSAGLASLVTYSDGTSDIGAWREGVPTVRKSVYSVLQNERLLVDRGAPASTVSGCVISCWGETIGSRTSVARAGLGVTAGHQLVWAAGEELEPAGLAAALTGAGAVRAMQLDINPDWVAGYLYVHRSSGPRAVPVVPGQNGIAGQLLEPYSRDFLTFVAR